MISINYRDGRPIFEQVKEGFRNLIISGVLSDGDKMPSVRELAQSLAINPNTIQRAYRELEAEGCICSVPGKGSFVSIGHGAAEKRKTELLTQLKDSVKELKFLGMTDEQIISAIREEKGND